MTERVMPKQAAEELGMSVRCMYDLMLAGRLDIGLVKKGRPNQYGSRRNTYYIYRNKLNKVLGKETA